MKYMAAALLAAIVQGSAPNLLVGLWESDARSHGGIGSALDLRSDGTYVQASTIMVDGYYRVTGGRLVITERPSTVDADAKGGGAVSFEGDKCLLTNPDGSVITKERVGQAQEGQPPIVGVWRYKHPAGATAFERYTPDGRISLRIPLNSQAGRFIVDADTLTLTPDGGTAVTMTVKLDDGGMALADATSNTTSWRRVAGGAWYEATK